MYIFHMHMCMQCSHKDKRQLSLTVYNHAPKVESRPVLWVSTRKLRQIHFEAWGAQMKKRHQQRGRMQQVRRYLRD